MLGQLLGLAGQIAAATVRGAAGLAATVVSEAVQVTASAANPRVAVSVDSHGQPVGRAHVAVRGVHQPHAHAAARKLERLLTERDGVHSAETNALFGRVFVRYDPGRWDAAGVGRLVADAERACGLSGQPWAPNRHRHPAHPGQLLRAAAGIGLNIAGLGYSTLARGLPVPPLWAMPPALSMIDSVPRLRAAVEATIGPSATDALLSVSVAAVHTATRQPLGLLTDASVRFLLYHEAGARRRAWLHWDAMLAGREGAHRAEPAAVRARPVPLPDGPVERAAQRSALFALGGAGIAGLGRANAVLAAGVPKASRVAREAFSAQLDHDLSSAGSLVLDPGALRRLDRVDTVLLDADVLLSDRYAIEDVLPIAPDGRGSEGFARAHDLVDLRRPWRSRRIDGWSVAPLGQSADLPEAAEQLAEQRARDGATVLVLRRDAIPTALVTVTFALDPLAEALVASAARTGEVLVFDPGGVLGRRLPVDGVVGEAGLLESVRRLQRDTRVVALVARANNPLAAADVGIGLVRPRSAPPWGADLLCRGAQDACRLLDAIPLARQASRHGVRLALAGSTLGALVAVAGPATGAAARVGICVHTAAMLGLGAGVWAAMSSARRLPPLPTQRTPWHAMSSDAVLRLLDSTRRGLPQREAERRRREQPDEYGETEVSLGRATMEELATPLTPVLATGAGLSATAGSILDPLLITGVLLVNALIGGAQQLRTRRELRQLTARSAPTVRIHRGGPDAGELRTSSETVRADRLVVGEVIELHAGDAVPADCRLLVARGLEVDESSLTGESFPVAKTSSPTSAPTVADRTSMIYEGTVVATGRAIGVVVATGPSTEAGRTQRIIGEPVAKGGVQARLRTLTRRVLPASVAAGLALVGVDLLRGRGFGQTLARAVGLAVAAVPEGLPFVATVAELASARRLSARGTLVRNPGTIEALGRVDVLCFDKTGTLTEGRLGVRQVSDGTRAVPLDELAAEPEAPAARLRGVLAAAVRASPFHSGGYQVPHQTDRAVLRDAAHLGITANHDQGTVQHLDELAFEPGRGYHATLWRSESGAHISVKGAPEVILPLADSWRPGREPVPLDEPARRRIGAETERLARQGYRILAVAERASETTSQLHASAVAGLEFRGLLALADPVRPTAAQAVATLRAAGVEIMMITGDHPSTAESIAAELDALNGRRVLTGAELDALDDDALAAVLPELAVFARVTPEQKARIVRALRANGHAVAVTGDGANDAPAIRLADVGLALGEHATPAARQAADVVITDDRIETITDAIVEGRAMWASVRDALSILLGGNLGEIAYAVGTGLLDGGAALNARQLLLINMLTDVLPAMAVAVRPPPDISAHELLAEGPDASLGGALNRDIAVRAAITAISATVAWLLARPTSTLGQASTTGLVALVSAQLGQTLVVRGRTPLVAGAVVGSLLALAGIVQTPGVSHVAGCRPLLPHQWAIALTAAVVASAAQLVASRIVQHVIAQSPRGYSPLADRSPSTA